MAKAPRRCYSLRLPPKLPLMIFDLAYGRGKNIKLMRMSRGIVALDFEHRGRSYEVLTYPDEHVLSPRHTWIQKQVLLS